MRRGVVYGRMNSGASKKPRVTFTKLPTIEQRVEAGGQEFTADDEDYDDFLQTFERAFIVADIACHRLFGQALDQPEWFS